MNIFETLNVFIAGLISGIILYQSFIVASSVFKSLELEYSRVFLRSIFPKFFLVILLLGITGLFISIKNQYNFYSMIVFIMTSIFSLICYAIIPKTNEASDENNQTKFKLLHSLSVILTMIVLIINISIIFD